MPRPGLEGHVEGLDASEAARERTKVVLLTLCGHWPVAEALERLGLSRTRFGVLRRRMLEGASGALEPGALGRPPRRGREAGQAVARLEAEVERLRRRLGRLGVRLELAEGPAAEAVARRLASQARGEGRR